MTSSWETQLVTMVRAEIGDFDSADYSDTRLREAIVYSAFAVKQRARFSQTYNVDVYNMTISPDPYDSADYDFCVLTVYKTVCTILNGEARVKGGNSVSIKDGPSSFDNKESGIYETMLTTYQLCGGNTDGSYTGPGQAVLGPYSPGSFLMNWTRNEPRFMGDRQW
jgi:hypothetical protein